MYRALYRKWRPKSFEDVIGQDDITMALRNQIKNGKIGHAYIFTGTRGTGKTTCAKLFAKAVNCPECKDGNPCGNCQICTGIDSGSIMDVVEIDAASNNGVDNIRDLREETAYTPSVCAYKVYIIDEVHMLSTAAFNALLKIMEEPPGHVIFILATTEIHKVPATILSRCQRYDFTRISVQHITERLLYIAQQENIDLTQDAAGLIARLADGAMRDALSILDTCAGVAGKVDSELVRRMAGVTDKSYLFDLSDAILRKDTAAALRMVAQLREKSVDIKRLCDELIVHYRNLLLAGLPDGEKLLVGVGPEEEKRFLESGKCVRQEDAIRAIKILCASLDKMGKGTDSRVEFEVALFRLCDDRQEERVITSAAVQSDAPVVNAGPQPFASYPQAYVPAPVQPAVPVQLQPPVREEAPPSPVREQHYLPDAEKVQPQMTSVKKETAATNQQKLSNPPPLAAGVKEVLFDQWDQVVAVLQTRDKLLYANLKGTKAYYDGKRILIDGGDLFLEYMRSNEHSSGLIKQVISEVTGARYGIGPYKKKNTESAQAHNAEQKLRQLESQGVTVIYENE